MPLTSTIGSLIGLEPDSELLTVIGTAKNAAASSSLSAINSYMLYVSKQCNATCTQITDNLQLFIAPGARTGPINFTQQCVVADINCALDGLITASLPDTINEISKSLNAYTLPAYKLPSSYLGSDGNITDFDSISQDIEVTTRTAIKQLITAKCDFATSQVNTNEFVYIGSNSITGAISFSQSSEITNMTCAVDTLAKALQYFKSTQSDSDTKANSKYYNLLLIVCVGVGVLALIMIIVFLVTNAGPATYLKPISSSYYAMARNIGQPEF